MLQIKTVLPIPLFHSSDASSSYTKQRHHPDVQSDIDMDMDANEQSYNYAELDPEESGSLERQITTPGEVVTSAKEFMRGHGTLLDASGENVVATVAGTVERVNKLVSVKSVKSRYVISLSLSSPSHCAEECPGV
jgi:exosome complex component RRP4